MQRLIVAGRMVKDAFVSQKTFEQGGKLKQFVALRIAVKNPERDKYANENNSYCDVTFTVNQGDGRLKFLKKGQFISAVGEFEIDTYDYNGNTRATIKCRADWVNNGEWDFGSFDIKDTSSVSYNNNSKSNNPGQQGYDFNNDGNYNNIPHTSMPTETPSNNQNQQSNNNGNDDMEQYFGSNIVL